MRVLNDLMLDQQTIATTVETDPIDVTHMGMADVMATFVSANPANKTFTDTDVDIADDTITIPAHGFSTGMLFTLTSDGTLPDGLATSTNYYAIIVDANTIKVAASAADALAGTAIDIIDAGTVAAENTVVVTTALTGTIKLQKSDEPGTDAEPHVWFDITSSSQNVSATTLNWGLSDIGYKAIRAVVAMSSGTVRSRVRINAKGF